MSASLKPEPPDYAALYEEDIEAWAEVQVAALRRLASTSGPWSNVIDWEHVIEEIEDLGSEKREAVESLLLLVFAHLLELTAQPNAEAAKHWRKEVISFLKGARSKATRSMRSRIDLDEVWRESVGEASRRLAVYDCALPTHVAPECPFTFEELLDPGFDLLDDKHIGRVLGQRP